MGICQYHNNAKNKSFWAKDVMSYDQAGLLPAQGHTLNYRGLQPLLPYPTVRRH